MADLPADGGKIRRRTFLQLAALAGIPELPLIWSKVISPVAPPTLGLYLSPSSPVRLNAAKATIARKLGCCDFITTDLYGPAEWKGMRDVYFSLGAAEDVVAALPIPLAAHREFLLALRGSAIHAPLMLTSTDSPYTATALISWLRSALSPGNIVT